MIKVHLDTTYLMPIFGLEPSVKHVKQQILNILELDKYVFNFSPVSMIEIKWEVMKLIKNGMDGEKLEHQFSKALTSIQNDPRYDAIDFLDARINDISYELRKLGHRDYFDTIIGSSALWKAEMLITEDNQLTFVIQKYFEQNKDTQLQKIEIYDWKEFNTNSTVKNGTD